MLNNRALNNLKAFIDFYLKTAARFIIYDVGGKTFNSPEDLALA